MLKYIVIFLGFMSLFISRAYADNYYYLENPDPQNFEIYYDISDAPNKVIIDNEGNVIRMCWVDKLATSAVIRFKISKRPVCRIFEKYYCSYHEIYEYYDRFGSDDNCSVIVGDAGNTWWVSGAYKADESPAEAYKTWDCG